MKMPFAWNQKFVQAEGNLVSKMGEDTVMLNISNGKYYNLGVIGGEIWRMAKSPISGSQLIHALLPHYDVEQSEGEEHVQAFLGQLHKEGLICYLEEGKD
jgi:hypothetical protein